MNYNKQYKYFMNEILDIIQSTESASFTYNKKMSRLHNDIKYGMSYAKSLIDDNRLTITKITKGFHVKFVSSQFMPIHIQESIKHNMVSQTIYKGYIHTQPVTLKLGVLKERLFSDAELINISQKIFSWLYVCNKYSKNICKGSISIEIYFTEYKKLFPNNSEKMLTPDNVNSGYSYVCSPNNEIVIFRFEEWFKVFVHESMHAFGLQPISQNETVLDNKMRNILSIKTPIKVSEAYVEAWARIINATYSAIYNSKHDNDFYTMLDFTLHVESIFSTMQLYRVLQFMNLSYTDIIDSNVAYAGTIYREQTNTFAYYVLCGAFMCDPYAFMYWCASNNEHVLQFNNTYEGCYSFIAYIISALHNEQISKYMHMYPRVTNRPEGLRMSLVDV